MTASKTRRLLLWAAATDRTFELRRSGPQRTRVLYGKCIHCKTRHEIATDGTPLTHATVEHIVPRHHGGLDTLDNIVHWMEDFVCKQEGVKTIGDLEFGKGYAIVRDNVMKIIGQLKELPTNGLILVGHRKKTLIATESDIKVNTSSLDLSGKLKNFIMADSDAIGYVFRDEDGIKVSFQADNETEAGARCEHLRGAVVDFEWSNIYVD